MHKAAIGEWILSLVTSRDRAASVVGDLLESGPTRGAFWFWWSISRTALSLLWRELAADPLGMLALALRGMLAELGLFVVFFVACLTAMWVYVMAFRHPSAGSVGTVITSLGPPFGIIAGLCIVFVAGRIVARRSRGREFAACFALAFLQTLLVQIASLKWPALSWPDNGLRGWLWAALAFPFLNIPLWVAAALERRRAQ